MDELRFVLKSFAAAALVLALSQIKTNEGTIEMQIQGALVSSETAAFVNQAAHGGVKVLRQMGAYIKEKFESTKNQKKDEVETEDIETFVVDEQLKMLQGKKATQQAAIHRIKREEVLSSQVQATDSSGEDSIDDLMQEVE